MKSNNKFDLFLISRTFTGNLRGDEKEPYYTFMENDIKAAKLYFATFCEAVRKTDINIKAGKYPNLYFYLYRLGTISYKGFKVDVMYITEENQVREQEKPTQLQINLHKEVLTANRIYAQTKSYTEALRSMFDGRIIAK